ncbi:MAG: peroxidase, partial [Armatimonadota bacterium]
MAVDLNSIGIDPNAPEYQPMLERMQCNILKPHGRDFTAHLFLKFEGDRPQVKAWLRTVASRYVTNAQTQLEQSRAFTLHNIPGGLIGNLFLSAEGYRYLHLNVDDFPEEGGTFLDGMKHRGLDIIGSLIHTNNRDPDPSHWEAGYRKTIHAMLLLADDA